MTFTPAEIEAVRTQWPHWTDLQIKRHLAQRIELSRMAEQQRRQRLAESLNEVFEVRQ